MRLLRLGELKALIQIVLARGTCDTRLYNFVLASKSQLSEMSSRRNLGP